LLVANGAESLNAGPYRPAFAFIINSIELFYDSMRYLEHQIRAMAGNYFGWLTKLVLSWKIGCQ